MFAEQFTNLKLFFFFIFSYRNQDTLTKHKRIIFNGNGYSVEWQQEASRRGLPNLRSTPIALDTFNTPKNIELFDSLGVLNPAELEARSNIYYEEYIKKLCVEAKVLVSMIQTSVIPVTFKFQNEIADSIKSIQSLNLEGGNDNLQPQYKLLNSINKYLNILITQSDVLNKKIDAVHHETNNPRDAAHFAENNLIPLMNSLREAADNIELSMPAHRWPLPSYHEMMFHQD